MKKTRLLISLLLFLFLFSATSTAQRKMENLNRGLVAVRITSTQVYLSWRFLGNDPDQVAFNLYRDGVKINEQPLTGATNFTDTSGSASSVYSVKTVLNGSETGEVHQASVWLSNFLEIQLQQPAPMTMPDNSTCTYTPNDCSVGDVDGDGEYEIIVKWEPTNAKDNSQSGYTGNVYLDTYKLDGTLLNRIDLGRNIRAGAHYTQFMVADFDGDGKAEIICKTAPGTKDGLGNFISKGPAATASHGTDYRNSSGYILSGPEYLTVFSGLTGEELATANYDPARGTVSTWGDSYGNRVDRFLAGVAYLDGVLPSAVMCRGYYTRAVVAAWDYRNGQLTKRWTYDSGTSNVGLYGQGNHNLSIADVDNDGRDEIVWGSAALNHDGKVLYRTGLGHGDAMHVSDLDPDRPGLEVWQVLESTGAAYGFEMHDARTGQIIWGQYTGSDVGRGIAGNFTENRGFEMASSAVGATFNTKGEQISTSRPALNFRIYWDGDLLSESLDNTTISKFQVGTLFSAAGCLSNNSTKATPNLSADILGDWREEVIFRTTDNTKLRIFTTTTPTNHRLYTLMHDSHYRNSIAWQNVAYNQPPHVGFYVGEDMDTPPASQMYDNEKRWKTGTQWDNGLSQSWADHQGATAAFVNGDGVLFDITAGANATVNIVGDLQPRKFKVNSPFNVVVDGTGMVSGDCDLQKLGAGVLTLNNNNGFSGKTTVWSGMFFNNGNLANSDVAVKAFALLGGKGIFGQNVSIGHNATLSPGAAVGATGKLTVVKSLTDQGNVTYVFDFATDANGIVSEHDTILVGENWTISANNTFKFVFNNGKIAPGQYLLVKCSGSIVGNTNMITVEGMPSHVSYQLFQNAGNLVLSVKEPSNLIWDATVNNRWDVGLSSNWLSGTNSSTFILNDTVRFNDAATVKAIEISEEVKPSVMLVDASADYSFAGDGFIGGNAQLEKLGSGKLTLNTINVYKGKTIVRNGTLEIANMSNGGESSHIGSSTAVPENLEINGGTLNYVGGTNTVNRGFTIGQDGGVFGVASSTAVLTTSGKVTGNGKLTKEGAGRLAFASANDYKGGTIIKAGAIVLSSTAANTSGMGQGDTITLQGGSLLMFDNAGSTISNSNWNLKVPFNVTGNLVVGNGTNINGTINGAGTLNYNTTVNTNTLLSDATEFTGIFNLTTNTSGGTFAINNTKGFPNSRVHLGNLVKMVYRTTSNVTVPIGNLTGFANSILGAGGTSACNIFWQVGGLNATSTFQGKITDDMYSGSGAKAGIVKVGTGTWTLNNQNTYSGGTTINDGAILISNSAGSALGTGSIVVNSGGTLTGTGSASGLLTVNNGGNVNPGNNGVGTLTINNSVNVAVGGILNIDIDKPGAKNDVLKLTGTLNMSGTINVNPLNGTTFASGDSFKVIDGAVTGFPTAIYPEYPGAGLQWDLSELPTAGLVKVIPYTGLSDLSIGSTVYPNPTVKDVFVQLGKTVREVKITITSLTGSVLFASSYYNTANVKINLDAFEQGVYMLQIDVAGESVARKIVKE